MLELNRQWGHTVPTLLVTSLFVTLCSSVLADKAADARREVLQHSYGTYAGDLRTPDGHMDCDRLITELQEIHANTYNWLIAHGDTDWDDLHTFLPLAKAGNIRVWVTVLP